jgi:4-amino-4-deoxy-L-arabinose transferase-like glycosyltransferase
MKQSFRLCSHLRLQWYKSLFITVLFFLLNLSTTGLVAVLHDRIFADALNYYEVAIRLYQGDGFSRNFKIDVHSSDRFPPFRAEGRFLFPYLVSLAFRLLGPSLSVANFVSALFKSLLVVPLILLGNVLFGRRVAVIAALLFSVNPLFFQLGLISMAETTCDFFYYSAFLALTVYAGGHHKLDYGGKVAGLNSIQEHRERALIQYLRRALLILAGLSLSLAYLTRAEAVFLVVLGIVLVTWNSKDAKADLCLFLVIPAVTLTFGSYLIYGKPLRLEYTATPLITLPTWWHYYSLQSISWSEYLSFVGGIGNALLIRLYNYLLFIENLFSDGGLFDTGIGLLPLGFLPTLALPLYRSTRRRLVWLLSGFIVVQALINLGYPGYARNNTEPRHGQLIAPFLLILAAAGLEQLWKPSVSQPRMLQVVRRVISGLLITWYLFFSFAFLTLVLSHFLWSIPEREDIRLGAEWARTELPSNAIILSRKPNLASFFSQRPAVVTPTATFKELMEYAHQHHVTHILITDREKRRVPNLIQGIEEYRDHFRFVHTAETFQVVEVRDYDFLTAIIEIRADEFVKQSLQRRPDLDWTVLRNPPRANSLQQIWHLWRELPIRVYDRTLRLSRDGP